MVCEGIEDGGEDNSAGETVTLPHFHAPIEVSNVESKADWLTNPVLSNMEVLNNIFINWRFKTRDLG